MPYQVSRSDTGQFVLIDPATDTVVIDDALASGFATLEQILADKPPTTPTPSSGSSGSGTAQSSGGTRGSSAFTFRGGPRYTPILLAVVLPFAWLAVLYFSLANLLSEHALDRSAAQQLETKVEDLEVELQALRSEIAGAPRSAKTRPERPKSKKSSKRASTKPSPISTAPTPGKKPPGDDAEGRVQP